MADRTIMALERPTKSAKGLKKSAASNEQRERVFDVFRRWGYYEATLDPLRVFQPQKMTDLELTGDAAEEARRIYCGNIGAEFMHLPEPERRRWIAERIEGPELEVNQEKILETTRTRGPFRAGAAGALPGHEAIFARGRDFVDPASRFDPG